MNEHNIGNKQIREIRKRWKKNLALLLSITMIIGMLTPCTAAGAEESLPQEPLASISQEAQTPGETAGSEGEAQEPVTEEKTGQVVSEPEIPEETVSEPEAEAEVISEDAVPEVTVSVDETEEPAGTEPQKKSFTVMLYFIGSDIERCDANMTNDLVEIMTAIKNTNNGVSSDALSVNFILETGGVRFGDDDESIRTAAEAHRESIESKKSGRSEDEQRLYEDAKKILWQENERWILSGDGLTPARNTPQEPERNMSDYDLNGVNCELKEFISSTVDNYPADQYMLFFSDHGAGPVFGYGADERYGESYDTKEQALINSWHIAQTMAQTRFGDDNGDNRLAWVGYDACLMADLEVALAWKPYARYFGGSEQAEGGAGWNWTPWVEMLCGDAKNNAGYTNEQADELVERLGSRYVSDYAQSFEHNATAALIKLDSMHDVAKNLADYSRICLDAMKDDPVAFYRSMRQIHNKTRGYGSCDPDMIDLYDFIEKNRDNLSANLADSGVNGSSIDEICTTLNSQGEKLLVSIDAAVISENHTEDMYCSHGMTVFFPFKGIYSGLQWNAYRSLYEKPVFQSEKYSDMKELDPYRDLVSLYLSVYDTGKLLKDKSNDVSTIKTAWDSALSRYKISDLGGEEAIRSVPDNLVAHRMQNEALKLSVSDDGQTYEFRRSDQLLFEGFEQKLMKKMQEGSAAGKYLYYGSIPGGVFRKNEDLNDRGQILYNFSGARTRWFTIGDDPVPIVYAGPAGEDKDVTRDEMAVFFPFVYDYYIALALVIYDKGSDVGTIVGIYPFDIDTGNFARFIPYNSGDMAKYGEQDMPIPGNVEEFLDGFTDRFDFLSPDFTAVSLPLTMSGDGATKLTRNYDLTDNNDFETGFFAKDIFDSYYEFGKDCKKKLFVKISLSENVGAKKKGEALKEKDLQITLTDEDGNLYGFAGSGNLQTMNCYIVKDGKKLPLTGDGDIFYQDGDEFVRLSMNEATQIFLSANAADADAYRMIDNASYRLGDSFELSFAEGGESVTVPVYDPKDSLTIVKEDAPFYYLNYLGLDQRADYRNCFRVMMGNVDVTTEKNCKLMFAVRKAGEQKFAASVNSMPKDLKPGDSLAVFAVFEGKQANILNSPLVLEKTPVNIAGTETVAVPRLSKLTASYNGKIEMRYLDCLGRVMEKLPDEKYRYTSLLQITSANSAAIDISAIDNTRSGVYRDLIMAPDGLFKEDFTDYFEVKSVVLEEYRIISVSKVSFRSAKDSKVLAAAVNVSFEKAEKGRIAVSSSAITIQGDIPVEWYLKNGAGSPTLIYTNENKAVTDPVYVEQVSGNKWNFFITGDMADTEVIFYAGYPAEAKNEGTVEAIIDPITPVEYTGKNIVTTKSKKNGSKVIGLVVRSADDRTVLKEDVDYSVSYKNNKNAAEVYDRKPPTLIIKGKNKYKGLKYEIKFTILPFDLANAVVEANSLFAPLASNKTKGVSLKTGVKLPSGVKVPNNYHEIHYFTTDEKGLRKEITTKELFEAYKGDKIFKLYVSAKAQKKSAKSDLNNYVEGSSTDPANEPVVYAYPKQSGSLKVTLKKTKYVFADDIPLAVSSVLSENNIKSIKVGTKKVSSVSEALCMPPVAYLDNKMTGPVSGDLIRDAGIFYVRAELTDENKLNYRSFNPLPVKITVTGTKLAKKDVKLENNTFDAAPGNERDPKPVSVCLCVSEKINCDHLDLNCTTRDGSTVEKRIDLTKVSPKNGVKKVVIDDIDNGSPGNYKLKVYPSGGFTGILNLTYHVQKK